MINGFKKEFMFFARGGRLAGLLIVMIALAVVSPILFGFTSAMMSSVKDVLPDNTQYAEMAEMVTSFSASDMVMYNIEYISGIGSIVVLFLFKGAAGGEQKKRSVMIPHCAGLTAERYALPKFVIYPIVILVISFAAAYIGAGMALVFFPSKLEWDMVFIAAICSAVYLAFSTAMQFCVGLCTGKSNLAIVIVIVMHITLPSLLNFFRVDRFNPFALSSISLTAAMKSGESGNPLLNSAGQLTTTSDISTLNVIVSLSTAVIITALMFYLTIFVLHTQEVHNEGDEPVL